MIISINESQHSKLFVLVEGAQSNNEKAARDYLRKNYNFSDEQSLKFIGGVKHDIPNSRLAKSKFMLGVVRMVCGGGIVVEDFMRLNTLLKFIASDAHVNDYDRNLNGLSFDELNVRFSTIMNANVNAEREELSSMNFGNASEYTIVPIMKYEDAHKYARYVTWCVTADNNLYNAYTYDGVGCFYFCLRKGFENAPKEKTDGCPLDEYGLSMIAVSITPEGAPNTITCRWNHECGGSDNVMDAKQLSEIIGYNFYEVFKPKYNEGQLRNMDYVSKEEAIEILSNNGDPNQCSKTISYLMRKGDKDILRFFDIFYEVADDNDDCYEFETLSELENEGFDSSDAIHYISYRLRNGRTKLNIVGEDDFGENMPKLGVWVDNLYPTKYESLYIVRIGEKENIINSELSNMPILSEWAKNIDMSSICPLEKKYCFYKASIRRFTFSASFSRGQWALFSSDGEKISEYYSYINLLDDNLIDMKNFFYNRWNGLNLNDNEVFPYMVSDENHKRNLLSLNGELLFPYWCDSIIELPNPIRNKVGIIKYNGIYYFVSPNGKTILGDKNGYEFITKVHSYGKSFFKYVNFDGTKNSVVFDENFNLKKI